MSGAEQFLRVRARLFAIAAEEGVGMVFQRLALGRDRALAFAQVATPGSSPETFITLCSFDAVDASVAGDLFRPSATARSGRLLPCGFKNQRRDFVGMGDQ